MITNEERIEKFQQLIDEIESFRNKFPDSVDFKKWKKITEVNISRIFGENSRHMKNFESIRYLPSFSARSAQVYRKRFMDGLNDATAVLQSCIEEISDFPTIQGTEEDSHAIIEMICLKFHNIARQLRSRYSDRSTLDVNDEYDVQDLLHALLLLYFDDIRPEEYTPSYGGKSSRMDFLIKQEQIVIEVKKTRGNLGAKELGDQLILDIERYQGHSDCQTLICFVYDPEGRISNPKGIENDLNRDEENFSVKVMIYPK